MLTPHNESDTIGVEEILDDLGVIINRARAIEVALQSCNKTPDEDDLDRMETDADELMTAAEDVLFSLELLREDHSSPLFEEYD